MIHDLASRRYFRRSGVVALTAVTLLTSCGEMKSGGSLAGSAEDIEMKQGAIVGPGLGNLSYASNELFKMVGAIIDDPGAIGGHGNVAMVNGYLATIYTFDGGGSNASFAFWNVSNPRSPVRAFNYRQPANSKLREAHGWGLTNGYAGKTYVFAQSTTGTQVGATQTIVMSSSINIGMAVTSHTTNATLATGTFDGVTITTP